MYCLFSVGYEEPAKDETLWAVSTLMWILRTSVKRERESTEHSGSQPTQPKQIHTFCNETWANKRYYIYDMYNKRSTNRQMVHTIHAPNICSKCSQSLCVYKTHSRTPSLAHQLENSSNKTVSDSIMGWIGFFFLLLLSSECCQWYMYLYMISIHDECLQNNGMFMCPHTYPLAYTHTQIERLERTHPNANIFRSLSNFGAIIFRHMHGYGYISRPISFLLWQIERQRDNKNGSQ